MNLYLRLNEEWVAPDVNTESENAFALNFAFDSLENPTDYISTYSYDFELPKTTLNNKIFGMYGEMQHSELFPPNKLIEYIYIGGGNTISRGECYITEINESAYVLAMNGSLNTIFKKLLNCGWNKKQAEEDDEYFLFDEVWKNVSFSPTTMKSSFEQNVSNIPFAWSSVKDYPFQLQRFNYICGFAPTQPNDDSFKSDKTMTSNGVEGDLSEEANAMAMAEWKVNDSSLRPYIYVLRLWQIFQEKCKEVTDYEMILDNRWFNNSYEYLKDLVYMLPSTKGNDNEEFNNAFAIEETLDDFVNNTITFVSNKQSGEVVKMGYLIPMRFDLNKPQTGCVWNFNMEYGCIVDFKVRDGRNNVIHSKKICYVFLNDKKRSNGNYQYNLSPTRKTQLLNIVDEVIEIRYSSGSNITSYKDNDGITRYIYQFPSLSYDVIFHRVNNYYSETEISWINWTSVASRNNHLFRPYIPSLDAWQYMDIFPDGYYTTSVAATNTLVKQFLDNQLITLEKLFKDVNPFAVLLKYAKMLGMIFYVDDNNQTISVMRRSDFIWDCFNTDMSHNAEAITPYTGYMDITDVTDFKRFSVTPLAWATRNVIISFSEDDDEYAERYFDKYGIGYGGLKILTENRLNNDTEELLNNSEYNTIAPCIVTTENVRPYDYLITANADYILDKDEFLRPIENCFAFRLANGTWNSELRPLGWRTDANGTFVLISTNSNEEEEFWHLDSFVDDLKCYVRPIFSDVRYNQSILFAMPNEVYNDRDYSSYSYVFQNEWFNYIEEIYNIENKTLSVNAYLDGELYDRITRCPFVVLGGIGYLVCKVSNWSEYNKMVKIDLRQIDSLTVLQEPSKSFTDMPLYLPIDDTPLISPINPKNKRLVPQQ